MSNSIFFTNYNPQKCPCFNCNERHMACHGECAKFKEFNDNKPKRKARVIY